MFASAVGMGGGAVVIDPHPVCLATCYRGAVVPIYPHKCAMKLIFSRRRQASGSCTQRTVSQGVFVRYLAVVFWRAYRTAFAGRRWAQR